MDIISNSYLPWTTEDDNRLRQLYNEESLGCMEIGGLFKRTPGSIAARLVKLKLINNRFKAKDYEQYRNSDLYKKVCEVKREKKSCSSKSEKIKTELREDLRQDIIDLKGEIRDLKGDIREMKNSMRMFGKQMEKMYDMIESIYEFEK